jgi:hypothetical protein
MKRIVAGMTLVALTGMLVAATPAFAGGRPYYRGHRGHVYHHHGGNGAGYLIGGLALGALTGVVIGSLVAPRPVYADPPVVYQPAPPPVVVQPAPVYAPPPPPVCTDYYVPNTYRDGVWVGAHWERICR